MDFYEIEEKSIKNGAVEIYPDFKVCRSKDIMVRGKSFYAIWDEESQQWSTDEYEVARIIDKELHEYYKENKDKYFTRPSIKLMSNYSSKSWVEFKNYISRVSDNYHELDTKIIFSNTETKKEDYISKRLSYPLVDGKCEAFEEIISTLYSPSERAKIEWSIGAIISGDSKYIQKFIVFYGDPGTGKSTILEIIQKLFEDYYTIFEAKSLTTSSNIFATEAFKSNPLIAIQHDGDLSKIEDNSKLNSIVSHEEIMINEKYKSSYPMRVNCFLYMATNKPVKITDAKAGLIRRLIDVRPTGNKIDHDRYNELMELVNFELGSIASHCLKVYKRMGKNYYDKYRPVDMMYKTDPFFNFVEDCVPLFVKDGAFGDGITLRDAYRIYKEYCDDTNMEYKMQMYKFREELKNYFRSFDDRYILDDGTRVRSFYRNFIVEKFTRESEPQKPKEESIFQTGWIKLENHASIFDKVYSNSKAQLATKDGIPLNKWDKCKTVLSDIDTTELHYVKPDENHIVIDFDIKDEQGNKSLEKNLEAANQFPKTYAEVSKSGAGIHLHYIYDGDVETLSRIYDDNIEIKVFKGGSSLRRKLTLCTAIPIATISSGLPLKPASKGAKMIDIKERFKNDKEICMFIKRILAKEFHANTKPSIDFINKVLNDLYESGKVYDVTCMRPSVLAFAASSSNQSATCIKIVNNMKFKSEEAEPVIDPTDDEKPLVFYDIEIFPNLFLLNYKFYKQDKVYRLINPKPGVLSELVANNRLVGYNCRRYDNHIVYAAMMGFTNEQLYQLSQRIIGGSSNCFFGEAYNLSYADIYDFAAVKQSLKKWEIELGIHHLELGLPWDQPVPEDQWQKVAEYCDNDVISTEAVWDHLQQDFIARKVLSELSGLTVNDTTRAHTTKIIFGNDKKPKLEYTDLSETFPGYEFKDGHNMYRGVDVSFGGYVYAEPGMYVDVALLDVESLHPHSIKAMNCFGEYTERFVDILDARLDIKHGDFESAKKRLNGVLAPYLTSQEQAKALAYALKIIINSVYGYTSATFDNPFKDPRNKNNIVALRGALFMKTLQDEVESRGFTVAHIKTDSIKIPNATPEIIDFCMNFAKKYGYKFEHEATYERMCLVNNTVYIAKYSKDPVNGKHAGEWTATGTQFQVPYVFKTLFSKEPIIFDDLCETKSVKTSIYLDLNEGLPRVELYEDIQSLRAKLLKNPDSKITKKEAGILEAYSAMSDEELKARIAEGHNYIFIGRIGRFCPVLPDTGGGLLVRVQDDKYQSVVGSVGYRWKESEVLNGDMSSIDKSYYKKLVDEAIDSISEYGDAEWFINN